MPSYLFLAGLLAIVVGVIHSVLGEIMIFKRMRVSGIIPTDGRPLLRESHVRILWATWHIVTLFGFGIAAILFHMSSDSTASLSQPYILNAIAVSMLTSAALVLVATKAKHPGWIGLLVVAILCWLS